MADRDGQAGATPGETVTPAPQSAPADDPRVGDVIEAVLKIAGLSTKRDGLNGDYLEENSYRVAKYISAVHSLGKELAQEPAPADKVREEFEAAYKTLFSKHTDWDFGAVFQQAPNSNPFDYFRPATRTSWTIWLASRNQTIKRVREVVDEARHKNFYSATATLDFVLAELDRELRAGEARNG